MMPDSRDVWAEQWRATGVSLSARDVYYYMDTIKLNYARSLLPACSRCLEVGAGSGRLSALLARDGHALTCLDYTRPALEATRRNFASIKQGVTLVQGDAFALPFDDDVFDGVFSTGLLEHFPDPAPIVHEMVRVLRPGGVFFSDIVPRKFSLLRALDFLRPQPPVFERPFTSEEIRALLTQAQLEAVTVFPAGVFPTLWLPFVFRNARYRHLHGRFVGATLPFWKRLDKTRLAEKLGFYWFCAGYKREQPSQPRADVRQQAT